MAVDIRNAKKRKGTEGPKHETTDPGKAKIMDIDENGQAVDVNMEDAAEDDVIQGFIEFLKENDVTEEDIKGVFDALITSGNIIWDFELFGSIDVEFKIRPAWVDDYILELIDKDTAKDERVSMARYNNMIATCNLAASLHKYGDEEYSINTKEDLDKAIERVRQFAYVVQNALVKKLAIFDRTIAIATSDWAVKNFTKPRKEK